jgi:hypothetical protein
MTTIHPYFWSILLLAALASCKKNPDEEVRTNISITLEDTFTDAPLPEVSYSLSYSLYGQNSVQYSIEGTSNSQGKIELKFLNGETPTWISYRKPGYIFKSLNGIPFVKGADNTFTMKMQPFDATISLEIENHLATNDTLSFRLQSNIFEIESGGFQHELPFESPLVLTALEKRTIEIPTIANDPLSIYWTWNTASNNYVTVLQDVLTILKGEKKIYHVKN